MNDSKMFVPLTLAHKVETERHQAQLALVAAEAERDAALALVTELREALKGANAEKARLSSQRDLVANALQNLMDAEQIADKQWIGLNMNNPGERRAYEILQAARINANKALKAALNADEGRGSK